MKIKKSKFAKLLSLALPIAAISVVAPVVLTSCGTTSSTDTPSNGGNSSGGTGGDTGGSSGGTTTPTENAATWDKTKLEALKDSGVTVDSDGNPVVSLTSTEFEKTGISINSKYDDIVKSLKPSTTSVAETKSSVVKQSDTKEGEDETSTATLYSVLSGTIDNLDKFDVTLNIATNPVVFDYTNDTVGNTFSGEFILKPKSSESSKATETTLKFTINNFNDSNNADGKLTWNVDAILAAFKNGGEEQNNLPDVTPEQKGASAVIDLSNQQTKPTLSQVMVELSNTTISGDEIQKFITNNDQDNYDVSKAQISNWAPTVDMSKVFTRIVIPNKTDGGENAIMYIAYTGYTVDCGNAAWNRNISYYDATDASKDLWDKEYNEPVINLSSQELWDTGITSSSKKSEITEESKAKQIAEDIAKQYVLGYGNFTFDSTKVSISTGAFDANGHYSSSSGNKATSQTDESADKVLTNNTNVIQIKFFLKITNFESDLKAINGKDMLSGYNETYQGFYKAFYITGYSVDAA